MIIEFYGVRGSYPVPGKNTMLYGGNTTCVSISKIVNGNINRIIIDSGTGIIQLGKDILTNFFQNKEKLDQHIFFTHLHPDHTQGFPFFALNFFKNSNLSLYGMHTLNKHIGDILTEQMYPPSFPIEYKDLKSTKDIFVLTEGQEVKIGDFVITCMHAHAPSHPQQGAMYYKIQDIVESKSVVCIWDNESKIGGDKAVIRFAKDCNIMIHDAQYTTSQYMDINIIVQGFGHSTFEMARDNALQANVKNLICTHHNPNHSDADLIAIEKDLINKSSINLVLAKEREKYEI